MTVGAFALILIAVHIVLGWLLIIHVMNLYAGYPYWELAMDMFWPVGTPGLILLVSGILLQVNYLRKRRKGASSRSLPATIPAMGYPLLVGLLLGIVSVRWFAYLFENYPLTEAMSKMTIPVSLLVSSLFCFSITIWLKNSRS